MILIQQHIKFRLNKCHGFSRHWKNSWVRNCYSWRQNATDGWERFALCNDNICQLAFLELRRVGSIRHLLSVKVIQILVTSLVLSCINYCNSLLTGLPQCLLDKLQRVQSKLLCPPHIQVHQTYFIALQASLASHCPENLVQGFIYL